MTLCCLLLSLLLCTPLLMVTKLEMRQNMVTNKTTSYCYEVKIETVKKNENNDFIGLIYQIHQEVSTDCDGIIK